MKIRYILIGSQFRVKSINLLAWQHDIDCFKMQKKVSNCLATRFYRSKHRVEHFSLCN